MILKKFKSFCKIKIFLKFGQKYVKKYFCVRFLSNRLSKNFEIIFKFCLTFIFFGRLALIKSVIAD